VITKTIRIWDGCRVVGLISIGQDGGSVFQGATGGAENSSKPDIEIDPWAGLIVDHDTRLGPRCYKEVEEGGY
jgi:hypothetical protein